MTYVELLINLPTVGLGSFLPNYLLFQILKHVFLFVSAVCSSESSGLVPSAFFNVDLNTWKQEEERGIFN